MSVVGAVFVEGWWLAFPDIKSACLAAALGEIFATMEEKYGKCRTSDGRPQTISFQDVERSGLRGNFWRFVILRCCFKERTGKSGCSFAFFMVRPVPQESSSSLLPNQ